MTHKNTRKTPNSSLSRMACENRKDMVDYAKSTYGHIRTTQIVQKDGMYFLNDDYSKNDEREL